MSNDTDERLIETQVVVQPGPNCEQPGIRGAVHSSMQRVFSILLRNDMKKEEIVAILEKVSFEDDPVQVLSLWPERTRIEFPLNEGPVNFPVMNDGGVSVRWGVTIKPKKGDAYIYNRDVKTAEKASLHASVVMHLTQLSGRLSPMLWLRMKLANHNILWWLGQSQSGGEVETRAAAVGAPKVMRALISLATTRCVFGLLRRSASRRYRDAELIRKAICMAAEAPRMASQIGARTSQQGFTATVRAFIVDFLCCCDREAKPSTSPPNQFVFSTTISSKLFTHNMLWCFYPSASSA